jgi:hypothetical protein
LLNAVTARWPLAGPISVSIVGVVARRSALEAT